MGEPTLWVVMLKFNPGPKNVFPKREELTGATKPVHKAGLSGPGKTWVRFVWGA